MKKVIKNIFLDLKSENKKRVFNKIRETGNISSTKLSYELQLSRPTIKQNLDVLLAEGYICGNGMIGHTGGRKAKAYSLIEKSKIAIGIDLTRNHITLVMVDLTGNSIYQQRVQKNFSRDEEYMKSLSKLINNVIFKQNIPPENILGVGIALPALVTNDHQEVFYGEILGITGLTVKEIGKYIPYPCQLFNDADAAGYAEISQDKELTDAFYISLSNNIGGAILINHQIYKGEGSRSGEIGHISIQPVGNHCYCGQIGCFETYCNATKLSSFTQGNLNDFFEKLAEKDPTIMRIWQEYISYLVIAINNVRMLFDCKIILGGYVGAYLEPYLDEIKQKAALRNSFESNAEYLKVCSVKKEALGLGSALPFIHHFWQNI